MGVDDHSIKPIIHVISETPQSESMYMFGLRDATGFMVGRHNSDTVIMLNTILTDCIQLAYRRARARRTLRRGEKV